ncbi:hypothetical protein AQUCO_04400150v1 [Aquilegia coerulea]|uniref:Pentacotripeptide-repeat region of PRORP domain-containing protein n=1 Tax=Aquilegia coerulea TaxID=218851 RepID=A0A2G5CND0_AQUCA|nr:hypothetical protein AQUCO_04400150v1 [Aquilegia coerulea]
MNDLALSDFIRMQRVGVDPNKVTFSVLLGVCCKSENIDVGINLHCLILRKGLLREHFLSSGLITLYSKADCVNEARKVFDEILERDAVSWNSIIAVYSQKGLYVEAVSVFSTLLNNDTDWKFMVNDFTFATIFKACAGLTSIKFGKSLHNCAIKMGFDSDVFVAGSAIDMYSKCGSLGIARQVFDRMEKRDLVLWNSMITGCVHNHYGWEAIELFQLLQLEGFAPNETTFACALKASSLVEDSFLGRCFHAKALTTGSSSTLFVGTTLVDMYSKYFDMEHAERAFQDMRIKNLASFNALITGYGLTGRYEKALGTFKELLYEKLRPDSFTFVGLLSSCSVTEILNEAAQVHACALKIGLESDLIVGNSLVSFYARCALMESALNSFRSIASPNIVSWAGLISGFAQVGDSEKALSCFCKLHELSVGPDEFCFSSVIKALANCASSTQGRHLHAHAIKMGLEFSLYVGSALIDMYAKCGVVEDSYKVFDKMPEKSVVTWNSLIVANAQNGYSNKALLLFQEMVHCGVVPSSITFTGVLLACSHAGLVEDGKEYYNCMISYYKISPSVEHCTCMVELLGRSGYINDAESFLLSSPFVSEPSLWGSLLTSCEFHKNVEVAVRAAEQCMRLEPHDSAAYVTLSNIYASKQLWHEVKRIRDLMIEMGVKKEPGCSWVEV